MDQQEDAPLKRGLEVARRPREDRAAAENRGLADRPATENREISEDERVEMFRMQLFNDQLPSLPDMPGWHPCWLTTTNPRDSIQGRLRLGYQLIRSEDVPGFETVTMKTGEYAGHIMVNEMIAARLPESLYQRFMKEAHYDAPLREETKLKDEVDSLRGQAESVGGALIEGDGMTALREAAPRPTLFE